jgi:predicted nucleotidyltransferase
VIQRFQRRISIRELEEVKSRIRRNISILRDKYKVKTIGVFGSYIRGEQGKRGEIDILVDFHETIDLFAFIELEEFLSETLDIKVDLVMKDTLKPRIRDSILKEAVRVE